MRTRAMTSRGSTAGWQCRTTRFYRTTQRLVAQMRSEGVRPLRGPLSCARSKGRRNSAALSRKVVTVLSTVLFVTSCVTYEPAASGLVSDGGASVVRQSERPVPDASRVPTVDRLPSVRPTRPVVRVPEPPVIRVARPNDGHRLSGTASWYCGHGSRCTVGHSGGLYAAIRRDLLGHRGERARVCTSRRCVTVTIVDCNCGANANLIDLYADSFERLAPLSRGRIQVTLTWL